MKKAIILFLLGFLSIGSLLHAQTPCESVTVEAFPLDPQSGAHNYFGVRVTLAQTFSQDVTVTGYIHADADENNNQDHPFSLTVTAGDLTAETSPTFYETSPTGGAAVTLASISPCPTNTNSDSLINIFRNLDRSKLQSSNESEVSEYLKGINQQIKNYLTQKFPQYLPIDSVDVNDPITILFGLTYAVAEASGFEQPIDMSEIALLHRQKNLSKDILHPSFFEMNNFYLPVASESYKFNNFKNISTPYLFADKTANRIPTWLRCVVDVCLGYFDVVSLINGLGTFEFGSVWTVVKFAVKKYVSWIGAAILLYDIGTECL